jgi:HK97 family phage prohead protease
MERRFIPIDGIEARDEAGIMAISGVTARFGSESEDLGGFTEVIEPGAFDEAVLVSDIRALYNHDPNFILGRAKAGTLELEIKEDGLHYRVPSLPDSRRDVYEAIQRGDVTGNSFAFTVERDRWEERSTGKPLRVIEKIRELFDVGPVVYPAYQNTVVSARCMDKVREMVQEPKTDDIENTQERDAEIAARKRKIAMAEAEA